MLYLSIPYSRISTLSRSICPTVTLYKCEAESSSYRKAHELRMCWDNCIRDGICVEEGILIAQSHSDEVVKLIQILNQLTAPDGSSYHFRVATWPEEGVEI